MRPKARTTASAAISRKFTPSSVDTAMTGIAMKQIRAFEEEYQRRGRFFKVCMSASIPYAQTKAFTVLCDVPQWRLPAIALQLPA